jgi:predicted transcriptional regulator
VILTAAERVLAHLSKTWNAKEPRTDMTQQGIAVAVGMRRSHVPRVVKALVREGLIEETSGRVKGRGRKVKLYGLTPAGFARAREIVRSIEGEVIIVGEDRMTVGEYSRLHGLRPLDVVQSLFARGTLPGPTEEETDFIGRDKELSRLVAWFRGDRPVLVVYGATGMGKTTLGRRFLGKVTARYHWRDVQGVTAREILAGLADTLASSHRVATRDGLEESFEKGIAGLPFDLRGFELLIVLDTYGEVGQEVVDLVRALVEAVGGARGSKLLVLADEGTPAYCMFYDRDATSRGVVEELRLKGLSKEDTRALLGNPELSGEAMQRIFLLTKGTPLYLRLIRDGDSEGLVRRSRFTRAEANLLVFSKDVKD